MRRDRAPLQHHRRARPAPPAWRSRRRRARCRAAPQPRRRGWTPAAAGDRRTCPAWRRDPGACGPRSQTRGDGTEAALATSIGGDQLGQPVGGEVRPALVDEGVFGIGRLPEQEVRQAVLARGADHQVRIGDARRVERAGKRRLVDVAGRQPAGRDLAGQPLRRQHQSRPARRRTARPAASGRCCRRSAPPSAPSAAEGRPAAGRAAPMKRTRTFEASSSSTSRTA